MKKYHMYKKEREITESIKMIEILKNGKFVTISLYRDNEPYILTLNYGFDESKNRLYFHTAIKGLKLDFITKNPDVCATVINDLGYENDKCSHKYQSVVFWGKMSIVKDLKEKIHGMNVLLNHLETNPDPIKERNLSNEERYNKVCILRLDITEMTGKEGL